MKDAKQETCEACNAGITYPWCHPTLRHTCAKARSKTAEWLRSLFETLHAYSTDKATAWELRFKLEAAVSNYNSCRPGDALSRLNRAIVAVRAGFPIDDLLSEDQQQRLFDGKWK